MRPERTQLSLCISAVWSVFKVIHGYPLSAQRRLVRLGDSWFHQRCPLFEFSLFCKTRYVPRIINKSSFCIWRCLAWMVLRAIFCMSYTGMHERIRIYGYTHIKIGCRKRRHICTTYTRTYNWIPSFSQTWQSVTKYLRDNPFCSAYSVAMVLTRIIIQIIFHKKKKKTGIIYIMFLNCWQCSCQALVL